VATLNLSGDGTDQKQSAGGRQIEDKVDDKPCDRAVEAVFGPDTFDAEAMLALPASSCLPLKTMCPVSECVDSINL